MDYKCIKEDFRTGAIIGEVEYTDENGIVRIRDEVISEGRTTPAPTQIDRVEAQATYTAMMTDTLLEG